MTAPAEYTNFDGHDRFKISCVEPGLRMAPVFFNYNPNAITYKRSNKGSSRGTSTGATEYQLEKSELITIELSDIILEGYDTKARCDLLLAWACPPDGAADQALATLFKQGVKLPQLVFQWGVMYGIVIMKNCTVAYERFDQQTAVPVRAKVSLSLELQPNIFGFSATNPTSGGLPGRRSHQVLEGENLVQVTTAQYGHPRYWRRLAQANNIDDPLRVKPGQHLLVPNPTEMSKD